MANKDDMFGIGIKLTWTPQELTSQINAIQNYITKNHNLKINLNLNEATLKGLERLSQLSKSAAKELNAIKAPMFNLDNPNQEAQKYIGTINNLVSTFQKFKGQTSVVYDEFGKVSLKVDTASGAIKRYTLQWDELTQRLSRTNMRNIDNSNVNIERELQLRQRLNAQIQNNAESLQHYLRIQQMNLNSSMSRFETQRTGLYNVDELNNLRTRLNQLTPTTENLRRNVGLLRAEFNALNTTAIANGINTVNRNAMSLGESLKLVAFKMLTWLGMGNLIFGTISQIKSAVVFIKDLDSAMINLKKVTNETSTAYKEFENDAGNLGRELARTTIEVVKATANFAKMGYTLREAKELAKEALIMQNVGDIQNVDKATQYLIATLKGFNLQATQSAKVVDIMNEVSNLHSITVDGLGKAYERSSAVMAQAGNTIEETTALLTSANAVVQNPEKVGNGFKTLALRLRGVDEEAKELFPKLEADLNAVGVQLRNVDGGWRSTYNILKDFSKVYMQMPDMARSKLLEDMSGKYQANILAATLQNFSEAEKTLEDALTSVGSSARENEIYLTSVEARVRQFKVSLEELYKLFLSSDLLKGGISVLGGLVSVMSGVSSVFGGIPALAGAATTSVLVFSSALRTSIYETIRLKVEQYGFLRSIPALWLTATGGVRGFSGTLAFLRTSLTSTRIAVIALQTTMTLGLSLVITGVIALVQKLVEALGRSKNAMDEQSQAFKDTLDNLGNLTSDYEKANKLIAIYNELSKVTNKTVDQKQKLVDVQQQLAQLFPSLVTGYDLEGQAILDLDSKHDDLIAKKKEEINLETKRLSSQFYQNQAIWIQSMVESQKELNKLKIEQKDIQDNIDNIKTNTSLSEDVKESYLVGWYEKFDAVSGKISDTQLKLNKVKTTYDQGLTSTVKYELESLKLSNDTINNFSDNYLSLVEVLKNSGNDPSVVLRGIFESIKKNSDIQNVFKNWTDAQNKYKEGSIEAVEVEKLHKKTIDDLTESLKKSNPELKPEIVDSIAQSFILLGNVTPKVKDGIDSTAQSFATLQETLSDSSSAISEIQSALDSYNETGKFSLDNIIKLSSTYPKLLGMLGDEKAIREELTNIIEQEQEKSRQAYIVMLNGSVNFYNKNIEGIQKFVAGLDGAREVDLSGAKSLAEAKLKVENELMKNLAGMWSQYYDAQGNMTKANIIDGGRTIVGQDGKETYITPEMRAQLKAYYDASSAVKKKFDDIAMSGTKSIDFSKLGMSKSDSKKKEEKLLSIESTTQALINQIQQEYLLQKAKSDSIQKDLSQAQSQKDYAKTLELTNSLISSQAQELSLLSTARSKINQAKDSAISSASSQFGNISERWFTGNDNQESVAYIEEHNKASEKTRKIMEETFKSLQLLRNAWMSNKSTMDENAESSKSLKTSLTQIQIDKFNQSISFLDDSISQSKANLDLYSTSSQEYSNEQSYQISLLQQKKSAIDSEILSLKSQLVNTELTTEATVLLSEALKTSISDGINAQKALLDAKSSIADSVISTMKSSLETQKDIALKSIDLQMDAEDKRHTNEIDNIEKETKETAKKYKTITDDIDAQTEAEVDRHKIATDNIDAEIETEEKRHTSVIDNIDAEIAKLNEQADTDSYNTKLAKDQKEAQDIQDKINILSLDNSLEAKAKISDLNDELSEKQIAIADFQQKHSLDLQNKNLQRLKDAENTKNDLRNKDFKNFKDVEDTKNDLINKNLKTYKDAQSDINDSQNEYYQNMKDAEDNKNKIIKDGLDLQKKNQEYFWNEQINNERYFASLRTQIINGNIDQMKTKLTSFLADFKNMNEETAKALGVSWTGLQSLIDGVQASQTNLNVISNGVTTPYYPGTTMNGVPVSNNGSSSSSSSSGSSSTSSSSGNYVTWNNGSSGWNAHDSSGNIIASGVANPPKYAEGGETQSTGMHYLDGKVGKPERVLSPVQTTSFNQLVKDLPSLTTVMDNLMKNNLLMNNFKQPQIDFSNFKPRSSETHVSVPTTINFNVTGKDFTTRDLDKISGHIAHRTITNLKRVGVNI